MEQTLVIEGQKVRNIIFPFDLDSKGDDVKPITKTNIDALTPKSAFILDNVLSPTECKYIIDRGEEMGFDELAHYIKKYRNNSRVLVKSYSLSSLIFERIKQFLPSELDISDSTPYLDDGRRARKHLHGKWKLNQVNELWRLCKYQDGGAFASHYDGFYERDADNRSYLTFMIYLSGGIAGGCTRFLDPKDDKTVLASVEPKEGRILVFTHNIWHDGETVLPGGNQKYIMRTDVMYTRVNPSSSKEMLENERLARELAREAGEMEKTDPNIAVSLYKRAFKLFPDLESEF
ncbi:hypothetical protein DFA_11069 [Cavenderia fasciculata]|uniref:Prolyl 4-hydroxylase alpha subunit domain-containing protein n=1 Tax=Cavenderia fasciculata TaxID=261658 RepID=F4QEP7_CACFS|nr:uncharacterized protein DFA_11069 [Cavenderia fasciculata]EGG13308.1 hypothetical protein DFA_11069 [Cavenderia fasciculata]|eukprot:XP_004350007.1 hypothetical protein DFA_11069 [Cavenderia fasciculata]